MSDRIVLRDVAVEALIGAFPEERLAKRSLRVDLDLACDLKEASASDALADTVDYFSLVQRVREACSASSYTLIEALAGEIARICLADPRVVTATVTVKKPGAVPDVGEIAVVLVRNR